MLLLAGIGAATAGILVAGLLTLTIWPWAIVVCWLLFLGLLVGVPYGLWVMLQLTYRHAKSVGAKPKEPVFTDGKAVMVALSKSYLRLRIMMLWVNTFSAISLDCDQ
jgi:hypothetical protein